MLSQVTRLLALVSAPPLEAATVRHVEVLLLQPDVVMVVVITSTGGVDEAALHVRRSRSTRASSTWAGDYLSERLAGRRLRSRLLAQARSTSRASAPRERAFLRRVRRAFDGRRRTSGELYVGGAAGLLDDLRTEEIGAYRSLIDALEKRAALLDVLAQPLEPAPPVRRASATSSSSRGCTSSRSSARPTGYANQHARRGQPARPAADGLREGAPRGARGGATSSRASSRTSYAEDYLDALAR